MKKYIALFLLFFATQAIAAPPARQATYTTNAVISSSDVTANEDAIFNYLTAGVDTYADISIVNADISASANIQSDKLNLTSIAQGVNITSSGSFANAGTSTFTGNSTFAGTTIADLGTVTTAAFTAITNLGAVTTADINAGTFDGTIGGTTPAAGTFTNLTANTTFKLGSTNQGDILYDNGTSIVRLTPGTSGQVLKTQGSSANPQWAQGAAMNFIQSDTFSAATTTGTITQTISSGDTYLLVIEGVSATADFDGGFRFNGASTNNYRGFWAGSQNSTTTVTSVSEGIDAGSYIPVDDIKNGFSFNITAKITTRSSKSYISQDTKQALTSTQRATSGMGEYSVATPSSITFERISGTGTITGRWYLYKLNTS